ncbi:hypothetical protein HDU76_000476 [Blyttiomyces sp. JEL0837]|nr:hypothetical protein HDU76_000476 [Blyttiomyces sp. JEL0837]
MPSSSSSSASKRRDSADYSQTSPAAKTSHRPLSPPLSPTLSSTRSPSKSPTPPHTTTTTSTTPVQPRPRSLITSGLILQSTRRQSQLGGGGGGGPTSPVSPTSSNASYTSDGWNHHMHVSFSDGEKSNENETPVPQQGSSSMSMANHMVGGGTTMKRSMPKLVPRSAKIYDEDQARERREEIEFREFILGILATSETGEQLARQAIQRGYAPQRVLEALRVIRTSNDLPFDLPTLLEHLEQSPNMPNSNHNDGDDDNDAMDVIESGSPPPPPRSITRRAQFSSSFEGRAGQILSEDDDGITTPSVIARGGEGQAPTSVTPLTTSNVVSSTTRNRKKSKSRRAHAKRVSMSLRGRRVRGVGGDGMGRNGGDVDEDEVIMTFKTWPYGGVRKDRNGYGNDVAKGGYGHGQRRRGSIFDMVGDDENKTSSADVGPSLGLGFGRSASTSALFGSDSVDGGMKGESNIDALRRRNFQEDQQRRLSVVSTTSSAIFASTSESGDAIDYDETEDDEESDMEDDRQGHYDAMDITTTNPIPVITTTGVTSRGSNRKTSDRSTLLQQQQPHLAHTITTGESLTPRIKPSRNITGSNLSLRPYFSSAKDEYDDVTTTTPQSHPSSMGNSNEDGNSGVLAPQDSCRICFSNPMDAVLVPCGHSFLCFKCARVLTGDLEIDGGNGHGSGGEAATTTAGASSRVSEAVCPFCRCPIGMVVRCGV